MLLGGSTHLCEFAPCDLSTLMPSSTVSHDCPNTVPEESCTTNCTCGSDGALECDPTLPYPTCEALTCPIGDFLLNCWLSGPGCASWNTGESCAVTCGAEGYQAANETSGTLTCACDEVAGDVILEVAVSKRWLVICPLDDPVNRCPSRVSLGPLAKRFLKLVGVSQQLLRKLSVHRVRRCSILTLGYRAELA